MQVEPHLAFLGGILTLGALASGLLGRPGSLYLLLLDSEMAWNIQPKLGDVLVLGILKQLRGGLIHLTASGGKRFCARRGLFPADHELQKKKSI